MKLKSILRNFSSKGIALRRSLGFTLIELLIVIAILGVLAAGVLAAIDPVEQLARGRDSGRKSAVTQLGRAIQAYYTNNSAYPILSVWHEALVNSGEIKVFPSNTSGVTAPCSGGSAINEFCYKVNATPDIVVYTRMESKSERRKGHCGGVAATTWYVYSSAEGKSGLLCQGPEPAAGATGLF